MDHFKHCFGPKVKLYHCSDIRIGQLKSITIEVLLCMICSMACLPGINCYHWSDWVVTQLVSIKARYSPSWLVVDKWHNNAQWLCFGSPQYPDIDVVSSVFCDKMNPQFLSRPTARFISPLTECNCQENEISVHPIPIDRTTKKQYLVLSSYR